MERESEGRSWSWETSTDAAEVHALLCACDAYQATASAPAPLRNPLTTERRVAEGSVHLLRHDGRAVATFTLSWDAPFSAPLGTFPEANEPAHLGRLAVSPEWLARGALLGVRCVRRALAVAREAGADVVRAEANPDLSRVVAMLRQLGFEEHGAAQSEDGRRRVYLQKRLR
jgi:GNAT superfamily N-acetyltransferase